MEQPLPKAETIQNLYTGIAPHIVGNKTLKKLLTLQMFCNPEQGEKMNMIIVGSTATGKSAIAEFVTKVMVGKSSFIQRDATPVGAREKLIASDSGLVIIDEFDKTKKDLRNMFLESLQSGTVTVDKYGQHLKYNARVCGNALCNPLTEELNEEMPLKAQISFSKESYLINRFHFIVPVYPVEAIHYPDIAVRQEQKQYSENEIVNRLRDIVLNIKKEYKFVQIDEDTLRAIGNYVKDLKEMTTTSEKIITPRLVEGFRSATKARARMSKRHYAKKDDFEYVKNIYEELYNG